MRFFNNIETKNILVIGDVMLDTYFNGDVKRISPEAPVPVFRKKYEHSVLGGAANVAANLIAAVQKVSMMAIVGKDHAGEQLIEQLRMKGINTQLVVTLERNTTVKTRFLADNNQQVLRLDIEDIDEINNDECKVLIENLTQKIEQFDLILISDYLKGLLSYQFTQSVINIANKNNIPVIIDVKDQKVDKYKNAYLIKPNLKELHDLTRMPVLNDTEIIKASEHLKKICNCNYVLTTCGARGMVLVGNGEPYFINSVGQEVYDVTGAGDTTIAYLAACIANGLSIKESVNIANYAAGIQVSKVGTSSVYWQEVQQCLWRQTKSYIHKVLSKDMIENFREQQKNKKIVFTNGCFDILHIGHVKYLKEASQLGDILIIGLNSDDSVKRLKGPERPINYEIDRAELLAALDFVDYIVIFEEDTPYELIKRIQPDILVKGGDYCYDNVVGTDIVEKRGGKLVLIPFVEGQSTTNIIKKLG